MSRSSALSTVRVDHDAVGMLAINVFDLVNREAFNASTGVSVTGIRENYLQLSLGQGTFVFLSLVHSGQDDHKVEATITDNVGNPILPSDTLDGVKLQDAQHSIYKKKKWQFPNSLGYEIYLQQIFHKHIFGRGIGKRISSGTRVSGVPAKDGSGLLGLQGPISPTDYKSHVAFSDIILDTFNEGSSVYSLHG